MPVRFPCGRGLPARARLMEDAWRTAYFEQCSRVVAVRRVQEVGDDKP